MVKTSGRSSSAMEARCPAAIASSYACARLGAFLQLGLDRAAVGGHRHAGHRGAVRQREDVRRLERGVVRVEEVLRDHGAGDQPADRGATSSRSSGRLPRSVCSAASPLSSTASRSSPGSRVGRTVMTRLLTFEATTAAEPTPQSEAQQPPPTAPHPPPPPSTPPSTTTRIPSPTRTTNPTSAAPPTAATATAGAAAAATRSPRGGVVRQAVRREHGLARDSSWAVGSRSGCGRRGVPAVDCSPAAGSGRGRHRFQQVVGAPVSSDWISARAWPWDWRRLMATSWRRWRRVYSTVRPRIWAGRSIRPVVVYQRMARWSGTARTRPLTRPRESANAASTRSASSPSVHSSMPGS